MCSSFQFSTCTHSRFVKLNCASLQSLYVCKLLVAITWSQTPAYQILYKKFVSNNCGRVWYCPLPRDSTSSATSSSASNLPLKVVVLRRVLKFCFVYTTFYICSLCLNTHFIKQMMLKSWVFFPDRFPSYSDRLPSNITKPDFLLHVGKPFQNLLGCRICKLRTIVGEERTRSITSNVR